MINTTNVLIRVLMPSCDVQGTNFRGQGLQGFMWSSRFFYFATILDFLCKDRGRGSTGLDLAPGRTKKVRSEHSTLVGRDLSRQNME